MSYFHHCFLQQIFSYAEGTSDSFYEEIKRNGSERRPDTAKKLFFLLAFSTLIFQAGFLVKMQHEYYHTNCHLTAKGSSEIPQLRSRVAASRQQPVISHNLNSRSPLSSKQQQTLRFSNTKIETPNSKHIPLSICMFQHMPVTIALHSGSKPKVQGSHARIHQKLKIELFLKF